MIDVKDASIIEKSKVPAGKVTGTYTFLKDMGEKLSKEQAISVKAGDVAEAKKVQNRWRSYFKGKAHSRRELLPDGKATVYLWLDI